MHEESLLRQAIVEVGRLLYNRKLIVATDGNISVRLDRKQILITPAGMCKGLMDDDDIVLLEVTDLGDMTRIAAIRDRVPGTRSASRASTETPMHLAAYRVRPEIGAVIHAHPPYATSFAISGRKLDANLLPETRIFDGPVGRVPYIAPGSNRLADSAARALAKHNTALLARHGAIAVGKSVLEAFYRLERLEFLAQMTTLAQADQA